MTPPATSRWYVPATISMLVLVAGAYYFGLQGPFLFDDNVNILRLPAIAIRDLGFEQLRDAAFSTGSDYPDRGLARLSFALNYYFAGGDFRVLDFKLTNLCIHLLNALLFWFISHRLLARFASDRDLNESIAGRPWWHWAALASALFWVLHPLHLTAVLYIVQRMTSMSAMFCFLGLALWLCGRERLETHIKTALALMVSGMLVGIVLGFLSKENAILLPYYALITEWIFFKRDTLKGSALRVLQGFFLLFAIIPAVLAAGVIINHWDFIAADYQGRSFTLAERLMTQSRILWFYLQLLIFPDAQNFGIYHDDIRLSRDLFTPLTTLSSTLSWLVVSGLALVGLFKQRLFAFAVLWYLIGHSIESSFVALELVFEHRNYLPVAGVILILSVYLFRGLIAISNKPGLQLAIPGLMVLVLAGVTFSRANIWEHHYTLVYIGVKNHPESARYHREFANVLSQTNGEEAQVFQHLQTGARIMPGDVSGLFEMSRIVNRNLVNAGIAPGHKADVEVSVDVLNDPLPETIPGLLSFETSIDLEIQRRAREEVLIVNSAEIGRYTQSCYNTGNPICNRMHDQVIVWIKLIMRNPHLIPAARALTALAYAKIMAASGDYQAAIDSVDEAISIVPEVIKFRLEKASLLFELMRLDEADRVLDDAQQYLNWSGFSRLAFDSLREEIRKRREELAG